MDRMSLADLTRAAGVSVRTVRYYIAEGLLPPPEGAGPQSAYRRGHLDRLRLIGRLKAAYLPLKEIRRRLAGLDDAALPGLLAEAPDPAAEAPPTAPTGSTPTTAGAYLDRVLGPPAAVRPRIGAGNQDFEASDAGVGDLTPRVDRVQRHRQRGEARLELRFEQADPTIPRPPSLPVGVATPLWAAPGVPAETDSEAWRRVSLGQDAELLIRESVYRRRRDRIDWLVRWARKVFG